MRSMRNRGFRKLELILILLASALLLTPAFAQGGIRPVPGGAPNIQQTSESYDVEIQNGRAGRLSITPGPARATIASGFSGQIFGDAATGRREPNNGPMAWVRYRNGRPFEAYQATFHAASGYWVGVVYALDPGSDLATSARGAWAFRARLSLIANRPGSSPRAPAPALVNPPGLQSASSAHGFGEPIERYFPLLVGDAPRGWMRITAAPAGAVTGRITDGHVDGQLSEDTLTGYYAAGSGMFAVARHESSAASEVLVGVLARGALFSGAVYRIAADRTQYRRDWGVGPFLELTNLRHAGCLTVPDDSVARGARVWLNKAPNSDALLDCGSAGSSRRWGFAVIVENAPGIVAETSAARFLIINLNSGLCLTAPSQTEFTQAVCGSPSNTHFIVSGIANPNAAIQDLQFRDLRGVSELSDFQGFWLAAAGPVCPGSYNNTLPWVVEVCGDAGGGHLRNSRGLWRVG